MTKLPLVATLLLTVAAPAVAKEKTVFTHDGVTYAYSETKVGNSTVIRGHAMPGDDFYYVVRNGQVTGKNDDAPVSFSVQNALKAQDKAALAAAG